MAIKPNEGSYAQNALKWGVAGLNIDAGMIGTRERDQSKGARVTSNTYGKINVRAEKNKYPKELGRFPANIVLDEEVQEEAGEWSRFFYCAKASRKERDMGLGREAQRRSTHPTVKPLKLLEYLIGLTKMPMG